VERQDYDAATCKEGSCYVRMRGNRVAPVMFEDKSTLDA